MGDCDRGRIDKLPPIPPGPCRAICRRNWPVARPQPTQAKPRLVPRPPLQTWQSPRRESPARSPPSDGNSLPARRSCQLLHRPCIVLHRGLDDLGHLRARRARANRSQGNRAAFVNFHVHLVAYFDARQLHQGRVKHQALRVADLRDGLCHLVKLCFTNKKSQALLSQLPGESFLEDGLAEGRIICFSRDSAPTNVCGYGTLNRPRGLSSWSYDDATSLLPSL